MRNFREYEIKVPIKDKTLYNKFNKIGCELIRKTIQIDEYYDFLPRFISKKDELLRCRAELDAESRIFLNGEFSWKSGRRGTSENFEVRDDISVPILDDSNLKLLRTLLEKIGFVKLAKLEKTRSRWILRNPIHNVEFEFDEQIIASGLNKPEKNIGGYLQATIETSEDIPDNDAKKILWAILNQLGFYLNDFEPRSYIEIYLNLRPKKLG